jgi:23S rRNA (cytidine2498-2'-O)-methyltransferase
MTDSTQMELRDHDLSIVRRYAPGRLWCNSCEVRGVAQFTFATCLPGLEPALKQEVVRARPELRFAYSRPGLVTFKSDAPISDDDAPGSPLARVWGQSIGPARSPGDAGHQLNMRGVERIHVFARSPDEPVDLEVWQNATAASVGAPTGPSMTGELVADVIVSPDEREPAWLGLHRADAEHARWPGGLVPADVPADAPSRAYAKIEEAIAWAELPVAAGQVALEIGCAPGGAMLALARRGLDVWGVDTGELAPVVRAESRAHHLQMKVGALRWEELPPRVDWLLVDVNLAPQVALHEVARLMPPLRERLRGAVITLKLNDDAVIAELPKLVERIHALGFADVRLRHLPSNRREICAVAR